MANAVVDVRVDSSVGRSGLARWRAFNGWMLGQLLELRSYPRSPGMEMACERLARALVPWHWMVGESREVLRRVEARLLALETPDLADVLAVEDLLREPAGKQSRACVVLVVDGRVYGAELCMDGVVTFGSCANTTGAGRAPLDRGRMSRAGHLVQVGGSPEMSQHVYQAVESAFRGWL